MNRLGLMLQEPDGGTILRLLRPPQMEDIDGERSRRRSFKERIGFKGMGCCGATWGFGFAGGDVIDADEAAEISRRRNEREEVTAVNTPPGPASTGMNLAAALAAERCYRTAEGGTAGGGSGSASGRVAEMAGGTPLRVSLMRLLEEADGGEWGTAEYEEEEKRNGSVCCVCMRRKKGAAFIPCGHTYCRVCSRELWLNRGSCPLCNRSINEILDIF